MERVAELLAALHASPPPRRSYPTVEEHVRYLFDASVRRMLAWCAAFAP